MIRKWTDEENHFLKENFNKMTHKAMAKSLDRTLSSINTQCYILRLTKSFKIKVGERFGRLVVIGISKKRDKSGSIYYLCKCDCEKDRVLEIVGNSLRRGSTTSCGCYSIEKVIERTRLDPCESTYNFFELQYKKGARERDIEYTLSKEQFRYLTSLPCYWCGEDPVPYNQRYKKDGTRSKISATSKDSWAEKQWIKVNGIDRIDNSKGYILDNCVPCCKDCNRTKTDRSVKDFLEHINKIYKHQNKIL